MQGIALVLACLAVSGPALAGDALEHARKLSKDDKPLQALRVLRLHAVTCEPKLATGRAQVIGFKVRMRKEPNLGAEVVSMLQAGAWVKVRGRGDKPETIGEATARWIQVEAAKGEIGWVFGHMLAPDTLLDLPKLTKGQVDSIKSAGQRCRLAEVLVELDRLSKAVCGQDFRYHETPESKKDKVFQYVLGRTSGDEAEYVANETVYEYRYDDRAGGLLKRLFAGSAAAQEATYRALSDFMVNCEGDADCFEPTLERYLSFLVAHPKSKHFEKVLGEFLQDHKLLMDMAGSGEKAEAVRRRKNMDLLEATTAAFRKKKIDAAQVVVRLGGLQLMTD